MQTQFEKLVLNPNFENVRVWAHERNLIEQGDVQTQSIKLFEEFGELCGSILKDKRQVIIDSIGDMIVVMINICEIKDGEHLKMEEQTFYVNTNSEDKTTNTCLSFIGHNIFLLANGVSNILNPINSILSLLIDLCERFDLDVSECLDFAYNEIKDRTGKMVDGNFVKD